jgi:hypothetical protein
MSSDPDQKFSEFAFSHNTFIENDIHSYLIDWYPQYKDLLLFDKYSLWTGKAEEIIYKDFLFKDTRDVDRDSYYEEIYISGRFDDRWRKREIRKI